MITVRFNELHESLPLVRYGKVKSLSTTPYPGVDLLFPGRHAEDTTPKGGDFCVVVTDPNVDWKKHQFKHDDIFNDVELKYNHDPAVPTELDLLMRNYIEVIAIGTDPKMLVLPASLPGIDSLIFLHAIQCLAVAEHRRYAQHEPKFGGRFLPFRFAAGIAEGLWTAHDAIQKQRFGRPAVERLEKDKGVPVLTQMLFDTTP